MWLKPYRGISHVHEFASMHAEAARQSYKTSRIVKEGCAIGKQNVERITQIRNAKKKEAVCIHSVFLQSERKGWSKFNLVSGNFMFLVLIASTSDDFPNLLNSTSVTSSMAKVLPQCHHYIQTSRAHFPDQFWVFGLLLILLLSSVLFLQKVSGLGFKFNSYF